VWCARHIVGDEPFAVLLPDELLWEPSNPCLKQMVDARAKVGGTVIAVMEVPEDETHRYGIVTPGAVDGALTEVRGFVEKPAKGTAPSRLAAVGRYVIEPEVMTYLGAMKRGAGGEVQLTDALAELIGRAPFHAYTYAGRRFDCGDKAGHVTANIALALERPDIAPAVRAWLSANL
jgi:UTP--glucose-1-phosphate uridylyltransferase